MRDYTNYNLSNLFGFVFLPPSSEGAEINTLHFTDDSPQEIP